MLFIAEFTGVIETALSDIIGGGGGSHSGNYS